MEILEIPKLYTMGEIVAFAIFMTCIGFCLGNIFQILIRDYKIVKK